MRYNEGIFKCGLIVGRFQHIHIGHQKLIDAGLKLTDKLLVFIGNANSPIGTRNPYNYEYRKSLIEIIYKEEIKKGKLIVEPLYDYRAPFALTPEWGDYVLNEAKTILGQKPELIIYGKDKDINKCFSKIAIGRLTELIIDRKELVVSATQMRNYLEEDNETEWKKYSDEKIHSKYNELKNMLKEASNKI